MTLVSDWKQGWKWLSIHVAALTAVLNGAMASLPYLQNLISPTHMMWANAGLGIATIWARLLAQGGTST